MKIIQTAGCCAVSFCLWMFCASAYGQFLPQETINRALSAAHGMETPGTSLIRAHHGDNPGSGVFNFMKSMPAKIGALYNRPVNEGLSPASDTVFVGDTPNDTLIITGTFFNNGPILVFNDGVLIFDQANATILGDIYVFQNGKLIADSSVIISPQQYFYQRSMIVAHSGYVSISACTLDFSGLSHSLAVTDQGGIYLNDVYNIGFTTAGVYSNATLSIDGTNQAGEFIMTDSANLSFANANTVLLWHHIDSAGIVDISFPSGTVVPSYLFDESQPGVDGVSYQVTVSNCTDVMWALMPEGGSDITITGSSLRAIGLWFTGNDTVAVSGLVNNSSYTAFTAPLSDRILQLNTTSVQTWSLYIFSQTQLGITGCIVGEVGSMGTSFVTAQGVLCDGSGGYYWASDTSLGIAISTTILGYIRSQGNGILLLGYGSSTAGASAIGHSVMVVTQSSLPQDPVAFEHGTVWRVHIDPPQNLFVDTVIDVHGSAWVDQGPLGSFMDFGFYTLEYKPVSGSAWLPVSTASTNEVHGGGLLAQWNTQGLIPGTYQLRLNTQNNLGDSIDAVIQVTLLPSVVGVQDPFLVSQNNPVIFFHAEGQQVVINGEFSHAAPYVIEIMDARGRLLSASAGSVQRGRYEFNVPFSGMDAGLYWVRIHSRMFSVTRKLALVK